MGAALTVMEELEGTTSFRGKNLYLKEIPVRNERCDLCGNHCRIRVALVNGENCAFGFLCGRDYDTKKFVRKEEAPGLLSVRKNLMKKVFTHQPSDDLNSDPQSVPADRQSVTVGIPLALQLTEELELWKTFFGELGVPVVTSRDLEKPVKRGKKIAGAEFCTPIHSLYGHVDYIADLCDVIFLPHYLEQDRKPDRTTGKE